MIIKWLLFGKERTRNAGIDENSKRIAKKQSNQDIYDNFESVSPTDTSPELHLVSHGNPSTLGGQTAEQLAQQLSDFLEKHKNIHTIYLHSCNVGNRNTPSGLSYADNLAIALSKILSDAFTHDIEIISPTGMTMYFPDGDQVVIHDPKPFAEDPELMRKIGCIDATNKAKALEMINKFDIAATPARHTSTALPLAYYAQMYSRQPGINYALQIDTTKKGLYFKLNNPKNHATLFAERAIVMSQETYNLLTEHFALQESQSEAEDKVEEPKNKGFYHAQ